MEDKTQHREFVQNVITRMNTNSFQIKGMAVTITSAFLAIYASNPKPIFLILPIPILVLFWFLDAYYLQLERRFRGIYRDICGLNKEEEKKTTKPFEMNPKLYKGGDYLFHKVLLSPSLIYFYLIISTCLIITYFIITKKC